MLSTMSGQSVLGSIPRTFDQTYQPNHLEMDAAINSVFDALDDIHFDLLPFTVQKAPRKSSVKLERRTFSWETLSTSPYQAISENTLASDEKSKLYICPPSSVISANDEKLRSILPNDLTGTFPNDYDSLDQRVHGWLSKLPDIPWLDVSYVDVSLSTISRIKEHGPNAHRRPSTIPPRTNFHQRLISNIQESLFLEPKVFQITWIS